MREYYIEFVNRETDQYVLQSISFGDKQDAKKWFVDNVDYVDYNVLKAYLMVMIWDDIHENYDIETVEQLGC